MDNHFIRRCLTDDRLHDSFRHWVASQLPWSIASIVDSAFLDSIEAAARQQADLDRALDLTTPDPFGPHNP